MQSNNVEGEELIMELEPMLMPILAKMAPDVKPFVDEKGRMLVKLNIADMCAETNGL